MLELTEQQLAELREREHDDFVERVRVEIVHKFPELAADTALKQRLLAAHREALGLGLESPAARTQFLYQDAFAPRFYAEPAIAAWLRRPGATPEQRWRDFMALARARVEER